MQDRRIVEYIKTKTTTEKEYKDLLYECLLYRLENPITTKELIQSIKNNQTGYNHKRFDEYRYIQQEEDKFATTPFEIEEGVLECGKCGSRRTFSFQKQTRSADEGATTFAQCIQCGNKWRHNN